MSKMVQVRNVPDALHRKLNVRAAGSGQTLSDYLLAELECLAARPTRDEMLARIHNRKRVALKTPAAVVFRRPAVDRGVLTAALQHPGRPRARGLSGQRPTYGELARAQE
jgi:antitoxin FitA